MEVVCPSLSIENKSIVGRMSLSRVVPILISSMMTAQRIDVHHHFFPPSLSRVKAAQSQAVGFRTPPENLPWSPDLSLRAMDSLGIQLAVLLLPSGIAETFDEAKRLNAAMHEIVLQHENRFAFWGCLGDWRDVEGNYPVTPWKLTSHFANIGALQLIPYVFDELGAVGIAVSSSYGSGSEASKSVVIIPLVMDACSAAVRVHR
jgi:6-methylsalicylate decarboxylase